MKIEINIEDYLSEEEIKEICKDHVKSILKFQIKDPERILSNMAYYSAFAICDSILTPEMMEIVRNKTVKVIKDPTSYNIFRKKNAWENEDSPAYLEVKRSIEEHKHLISPLIKRTIEERNYLQDLEDDSCYIGDFIVEAIKKGLKD